MFSVLQVFPDPAILAIISVLITGCAGVPGLFIRTGGPGQYIAAAMTLLAALLGIPASLALLFASKAATYILDWSLPFGSCELAIDPLSAFFLLPVFTVGAAGSLFALGYWPSASHRSTEPGLTFFYGLLAASMALLVMARNGMFFLMVWEIMALSAYFLLVTEHEREEVRRAGTLYLISTHIGTGALLIFFSLLAARSGSFLFPAAGTLSALSPVMMFLASAALIGFGSKAGIMPLHLWLPATHANAPSHVSALMSGVMLKMGLYGIFRTLTFFSDPPLLWGATLAVAGISTALAGIVFAAAQRDLKRLLAYSSIENIGIITAALGVALLGHASNNATLTYLCLAAALLHIYNHALFKPLLFLGSGVVIHASGGRDMNLMGGLGKLMPKAAILSLAGVIAICGIPPFNGFISEFLFYLGLFSQLQTTKMIFIVMLVPALALVGGVALLSFTKLFGAVFLGTPRRHFNSHAREPGWTMLLPMAFFAMACLLIGLLPQYALRLVSPAMVSFMPDVNFAAAYPSGYISGLGRLSMVGFLLLLIIVAVTFFWQWRLRRKPVVFGATWGCGYQRATARMQYVATSFSESAVSVFDGIVRQRVERPHLTGLFPRPVACLDFPSDTVLEQIITPVFNATGGAFAFMRRLQNGQMHLYMLYIFATLLILMLWAH
ncbi:MAG: hydrogenase [Geobacter sp.]|nr:hydrogenase [Geobacter sp.]